MRSIPPRYFWVRRYGGAVRVYYVGFLISESSQGERARETQKEGVERIKDRER